jgi:hypothetical protein
MFKSFVFFKVIVLFFKLVDKLVKDLVKRLAMTSK